jgi:rod shape-determining protein MreB
MMSKFRGWLSHDVSIDLGTANTLIHIQGQGIVLNEPSVVAVKYSKGNKDTSEVIAVGLEAKKMLGRTPDHIEVIRPLKDGVITDSYATEKMLHYFIQKIQKKDWIKVRSRILICVPYGATPVERKVIREAAGSTKAKQVLLIDEPMAAAIGAGLPVNQASGSMVLDIGGGTSEIAVLSLNGVVYATSLKIGGDKFDESIIRYIKRNYGCLIGEATAEQIKKEIGAAFPTEEVLECSVRGRHIDQGVPATFTLNSNEVIEALQPALNAIVDAIRYTIEHTPPELVADICDAGIILTGGGSLLRNLDLLLEEELGVPVKVADNPLLCVVEGGSHVLMGINQSPETYIAMTS